MTELGALPEEWRVEILGKICDEIYRYPTYYDIKYVNKGVIEVRGELINSNGKLRKKRSDFRYILQDTNRKYPRTQLKNGDFVMSVRGTIGKVAMVDDFFEGANITANLIRIAPNKEKVLSEYLLHFFLSDSYKSWLELNSSMTTIKTIQSPLLKSMYLSLPPLPEQRRIATILSTLDETVEHTEALIEKYKNIKAGLMADLLTRGIDEEGRIRSEVTHRFKDSALGRVPEEWEVTEIKKYLKNIKSGLSRRIENKDIGVPVLISGNIQEGKLDTTDLKYWFLDDPQGANISKYFLNPGDILLCFINSIEQIGKCCIYEDIGRETIYTTNLFRIQINDNTISKFLYYLIDSNIVQEELKCITKPAVNQASFTKPDFESIKVPLLSLFEQRCIAEILMAADQRIEKEEAYRDKLLQLKKGLMQDLLTGEVRVKDSSVQMAEQSEN